MSIVDRCVQGLLVYLATEALHPLRAAVLQRAGMLIPRHSTVRRPASKLLKLAPLCHAGMPFGPTAPMAIRNQVAGSAPSAVHKALSEAAELSPQQKAATTELQHTNGISSPSSGHLDSIGEVPRPGQHAARALNDGASGQAGRKETSGGHMAVQLAQSLTAAGCALL